MNSRQRRKTSIPLPQKLEKSLPSCTAVEQRILNGILQEAARHSFNITKRETLQQELAFLAKKMRIQPEQDARRCRPDDLSIL